MKIGIVKFDAEQFYALQNLLIQEGIIFEIINKNSYYDLIISSEYYESNDFWTISYPNSQQSLQNIEIDSETFTINLFEDVSTNSINSIDRLISGYSEKNIFINIPIFNIFARAFNFEHSSNNLDLLRHILYQLIDFAAKKQNKMLLTKWYYPKPVESAIMVSHDIDSFYPYKNIFNKNVKLAKTIASFPCKKMISNILFRLPTSFRYRFFPSILSFDELYDYKSTIFLRTEYQKEEKVTRRKEYKVDESVARLGHEIGLHFGSTIGKCLSGYVNPRIYVDPTEPWIEGIIKSKQVLEKYTRIEGCRSHNTHIWIPDSFDIIENEFLYDSSLYCEIAIHRERIFEDNKKFYDKSKSPNGIYYPFYPIHKRLYNFIEIPVTHFECIDKEKIESSIKEIIHVNGIINGLYHPTVDVRGLLNFLDDGNKYNLWKTTLGCLADWFKFRTKTSLMECPLLRVGGKVTLNQKDLIRCGEYILTQGIKTFDKACK